MSGVNSLLSEANSIDASMTGIRWMILRCVIIYLAIVIQAANPVKRKTSDYLTRA